MEKEKVYTMPELLKARNNIVAAYGLDIVSAGRLVGYYNGGGPEKRPDIIAAMIDGDLSGAAVAAAALHISLGVNTPDKDRQPVQGVKNSAGSKKNIPEKTTKQNKRTTKEKESKTGTASRASLGEPKTKKEKKEGKANNKGKEASAGGGVGKITGESALSVEKIDGEIIAPGVSSDDLPETLPDDIESWLSDFSNRYNIELVKASGQQWRSACIYVGQHIQKSKILEDRERERSHGGKIYNPERVAALLPLWEYITGLYKHIPLASDFIAFSGVSRQWFHDYDGRGLTSASVQIVKRAREIEESGLSAGLVDGRENPTGRIYYSKARLGWKETTEIVHVSAAAASAAPSLPVFDGSGGFLEDKSGENST